MANQVEKYFIPPTLRDVPITERDEQMYKEWQSEGKHKDKIKTSHFDDGFNVLVQGKRWAGIHMGMWEEGVLDGSVPYFVLFEDKPEYIARFASKEMFRGMDADLIMDTFKRRFLCFHT